MVNQSNSPPNILFILIDDLGWRDLSAYGSTFHESPNIDRLISQGMRFNDAYAACPFCSPTRASVLTGKYPATVGVTDYIHWDNPVPKRGKVVDAPYVDHLPQSEFSLARALGGAGYATWHIGKWHLGGEGSLPPDHGFEVNIGGAELGHPGKNGYFSPWSIPGLEDIDVPEGTYLTDYLTDRAIELLPKRDPERPFFMNLWYYSIHTPIQAKPEKIAKYQRKAEQMGLAAIEDSAIVEGPDFYPTEGKSDRLLKRRVRQSWPDYAAMLESLDDNIGRLLDALEESGEADNTIVVFTSDNGGLSTGGPVTCNLPLAEGKGWMQDGGIRVPQAIRWPGVTTPGSVSEVPVSSPDFYPTLLNAAGVNFADRQEIDGEDLRPLLEGTSPLKRAAIFWHYPHYGDQGGTPGSSIRLGDWKLTERHEDGALQLFNLREDIGETRDLAESEPTKRTELLDRLHAWQRSVEAKFPAPNPDWGKD